MDGRAPSAHATTVPAGARRIVMPLLAVVALVHSALVMLWVMPDNPMRDAVGADRVASYVNPYFEQSWSIFAPVPRRVGENVVVRATLHDAGGDTRVTEWHDITAAEDRRVKHLANPSRIHSATRRLASGVNEVLVGASPALAAAIAGDLRGDSRAVIRSTIGSQAATGAAGSSAISGYLRSEEMLTRLATAYAVARWGPEVESVQLRIGRRSVPEFAARADAAFADVAFTYRLIGWRDARRSTGEAQSAFDDYVRSAR